MTIRGSCLCEAVSFEVDPPFPWMGHCHCSMSLPQHETYPPGPYPPPPRPRDA